MANTHFESNNGVIVLDHTNISTPTNILIKGTNRAPERKNLLCKDLFRSSNCIALEGITNSNYIQKYDSIFVYSNKATNNRIGANLIYRNLKSYIDSNNADKTHTVTFRINRAENIKNNVTLNWFDSSGSNIVVTNNTTGVFSVTGKIFQSNFTNNYFRLLNLDIAADKALDPAKELIIEIELISLELGDHRHDPLLYMPETPFENSIINTLESTPLISNNVLTTVGDYRLEGEVSLFLQQIEKLIENNYELFKPSKQELHMTNILSRRI